MTTASIVLTYLWQNRQLSQIEYPGIVESYQRFKTAVGLNATP